MMFSRALETGALMFGRDRKCWFPPNKEYKNISS